jgi:hypothetical protein
MRRRAALGAVTLALLASAGPARADLFGPISLASESEGRSGQRAQQADYAHDPAISGNGEFVAFDGSFGGVRGVWRRDLRTGAVEPVAVGDAADPALSAPDAELPSISADGRYVSFTTTARLAAGDVNSAPDVYVRDMDVPVYGCDSQAPVQGCDAALPGCEAQAAAAGCLAALPGCGAQALPACAPPAAGAFTLVSAVNGSEAGLTYEPARGAEETQVEFEAKQQLFDQENTLNGAVASGRSALSANGQEVAFVTSAISNLDGAQTPALQVAVRNLEKHTTELVSVAAEPATGLPIVDPGTGKPVPVSGVEGAFTYGAVFVPGTPPGRFSAPPTYSLTRQVGASISADGSTVAWLGQDVAEQVKMLPGEALLPVYSEPLWRRIADGPQAPTLAVTGDSEPLSPACIASGESAPAQPPSLTDPCRGPFRTEPPSIGISTQVEVQSVPQLSADGQRVAFLASAPLVAQGGDFGQGIGERHSDLYVADMQEGLTLDEALLPLTELASADVNDPATTANIIDFGLSPNGTQVAFTTQRTVFPLGSPAYVSAPAATPGMAELFEVDLTDDTLTRVTQGFEGGPSEHPHQASTPGVDPYGEADGALSPSFSEDGKILAFSSTASNLVYGDGNTPPSTGSTTFDGSDAFVVEREIFEEAPAQQYVSPPPPNPLVEPAWRLGLSGASRRDGSVVLDVDVPASGMLSAGAVAPVLVRVTHARDARRRARRSRSARVALTRTVAARDARTDGAGMAQLVLVLGSRYRALAGETGGLSASVTVTFKAAGHPLLRQSIPVTFSRTATVARRSKRAARPSHARAGAGHAGSRDR